MDQDGNFQLVEALQYCDVCEGQHLTETCPELGLQPTSFRAPVTTRARLTLPEFLFTVDSHIDQEVGVFVKDNILGKRTQFGPFEAKKTTHEFSDDTLFLLKVTTKEGTFISLDTTNEDECNWMCLVRAAITAEEQNCIAYQLGTNLYYSTTKDIPPQTELRVWYAPAYARRIGKPTEPDGISKVMLGMKVIYPSVMDLPDARQALPHDVDPALLQAFAAAERIDTLPFACKRCTAGFGTESDLALHLREHIMPGHSLNVRPRKRGRPPMSFAERYKLTPRLIPTPSKKQKIDSTEDSYSGSESSQDEGEYEKNIDEDFAPEHFSSTVTLPQGRRIQPRRSLKGVRTSGFEVDANFVSVKIKTEHLDDGYSSQDPRKSNDTVQPTEHPEMTPDCETSENLESQALRPTAKRGRGRPRKQLQTQEIIISIDNSPEKLTNTDKDKDTCNTESQIKDVETSEQVQGEKVQRQETNPDMDTNDNAERPDMTELPSLSEEDNSSKTIQESSAEVKDKEIATTTELPSLSEEDNSAKTIQERSAEVKDTEIATITELPSSSEEDNSAKTIQERSAEVNDKEIATTTELPSLSEEDNSAKTIQESSAEVKDKEIATTTEQPSLPEEEHLAATTPISNCKVIDKEIATTNCTITGEKLPTTSSESTDGTISEINSSELTELAKDPVVEDDSNKEDIQVPTVESIGNIAVDDALQTILDELDKSEDKVKEHSAVNENKDERTNLGTGLEEAESKKVVATGDMETGDATQDENNKITEDVISDEVNTQDEENNKEDGKEATTIQFHEYVARLIKDADALVDEHSKIEPGNVSDNKESSSTPNIDEDDIRQYLRVENGPDGKNFICKLCEKKFLHEKYFRLHYPIHTGKFKCDKCGMKYTRKDSLKRHECKVQGSSPKPADDKTLVLHSRSQTSSGSKNKFNCDICSQEFHSDKYLFRHMAIHTSMYQCEACQKCFSRKDSLQRHILRCCPEDAEQYQVFICRMCQKTFATKLGRENHETHCKQKMCEICRCVFATEVLYLGHKCRDLPAAMVLKGAVRYHCFLCPKSFRNLSYLRQHQQIHDGGFVCPLCGRKLKTNEEKADHERLCKAYSIIKKEGVVKCDACELKFTSSKDYKEHYLSHSHPHFCDKCNKRFIKVGSLHKHVCPQSDEHALYNCSVCFKFFRTEKLLLRHKELHIGKKFVCTYCNKKFYRKDYFTRHVCKESDGSEMDVMRNLEIRAQQDKLVCHICGKNFVSSSNLNKHMKVHGEKTCVCPICNKKFHYEEYLRIHVEGFHEKKHQFQCSECGKILTSKPGLISHMKQFHSDEREFHSCPTCGKVFSQKGNMKTHMYSHTKERGFQCQFCSKAFKYPDQLNRHKLIHTMQNKLQCDQCDKKFVKSYDLKKHYELFHSGMMYVCEKCGARCGHRHTMVRHYKRKHPSSFEQAKEPAYLDSLFKHVDKGQAVIPEDPIDEEPLADEVQVIPVSDVISAEEFVSAEALQNLANPTLSADASMIVTEGATVVNTDGTIFMPGQDGTYSIQNIQQAVEGPDGQPTVVILQFVTQPELEGIEGVETEVQVQQVEAQVIQATTMVEGGEEVEAYIQQYVVDDELQEAS